MSRSHFLAESCALVLIAAAFAGEATVDAATAPRVPSMPPSLRIAVKGEMVDGDLPTTYRLPQVTSSAASQVATASGTLPLFSPPLPAERYEFVPPIQNSAPHVVTVPQPPAIQQPWRTPTAPTPAGSPPDEDAGSVVEHNATTPGNASQEKPPMALDPIGPIASESPPATAPQAAQLLPAVQRGYVLAQRGAVFAARIEFVQVLRRVAQAKDIAAGSDEHSQALAAGLRALDEADDFVPAGIQLEAELDVRATASSHRTPVLPDGTDIIMPHKAVVLYHNFAEERLATAVEGDQAGSMALYGLGRIYAQLAERKDDDLQFVRGAMTMYAAALAASPQNHLAANELGVLVCRTGRPSEAIRLFERTIDVAPSATAYHNLAVAQQKVGLHAQAQANEQESHRLAAGERASGALSRRAGVAWVAPGEMARVAQPAALTPTPSAAAATPQRTSTHWR
ncbi:MAG: hypothetical protein WD738_11510 [Pirellulales bacterium]